MEYKLAIEKNEVDLCVVMRRDLPDTLHRYSHSDYYSAIWKKVIDFHM